MVGNTNSEIKALELEVDSLYSKKKKNAETYEWMN
jgi:hypothetical protein